jgi:hypothetical protein
MSSLPTYRVLGNIKGYCYEIKVKGDSTLQLQLQYKARNIGVDSFHLVMLAHAGDKVAPAQVVRRVVAECLAPRVSVSSSVFDFGACIISSKSSMLPPYQAWLNLTNEQDRPMMWSLARPRDGTGTDQDIFWFGSSSGIVEAKGHADVQALFQPRACAEYDMTAALNAQVDGEEDIKILDIHLRGSGRRPQLLFDTMHVVLPSTPLGIQSSAEFRIINDGYDNVDLKHRLPVDSEHLPLELKFPEGTMVGIAKNSIPVVVTFQAQKATSFTARLEFIDDDGTLPMQIPRFH